MSNLIKFLKNYLHQINYVILKNKLKMHNKSQELMKTKKLNKIKIRKEF